ncbi:MAG: hypothetical protein DRI99_02250 [Candidatus Aminicenantes bacterium]|nr:MAG: hypothetical protein DRI99_02250 [Candidatus Aminicenantes bacterium]
MAPFSRRHFLEALSLEIFSWKWGRATLASSPENKLSNEPIKIKKYNPLGHTGLKVSDISFGAISLFDANVIRYAYDLGINYFDTAESYLRTQSEKFIGEALHDVRDRVIITTKHGFPPRLAKQFRRERIIQRVEASL